MTVQLVSSNPTKKPQLRRISSNPLLSYFLCVHTQHLKQLKIANAILFKVEEKSALIAAYKNKDPMYIFIPNVCIEVPRRMTPGIALAADALRRGISTAKCGLYLELFPNVREAPFLAQIGLQVLLFREGYADRDSVELFERNGVRVRRVDV